MAGSRVPAYSLSPRLCANHHHLCDRYDIQLVQDQPFYLSGWKIEARDLQNTEHREQDVRRHQRRPTRALWSTVHCSGEWEGTGKFAAALIIDTPNYQQWEIKPLGQGYTIQKVGTTFLDTFDITYPLINNNVGGDRYLQKA